jgi:hypothetical protein
LSISVASSDLSSLISGSTLELFFILVTFFYKNMICS